MYLIERLIDLALEEDIASGDITSEPIIDKELMAEAFILTKEDIIPAGFFVAERVFEKLDKDMLFYPLAKEGEPLKAGEKLLRIRGRARALLSGERAALNFLQRLSGIATHVASFKEVLAGSDILLLDTRKTTPGWRVLEKYAVRIGGAANHRMGLYDGVLIKDNHILVAGGILQAVQAVRKRVSHLLKIELEVSDLNEVEEALKAGVDIILLDNMDTETIKEAISLIKGRALIEVSGMIDKKRLEEFKGLAIDFVSLGALTHQAKAVDLSMRIDIL